MGKTIVSVAFAAVLALAGIMAGPAQAQPFTATADLSDPDGNSVGVVRLVEAPNGVLLKAQLHDLPQGEHAFHIHETGECEPPFTSAGGHYNPGGNEHGILIEGGMHAGDMPNIQVPLSGTLVINVLNQNVTLTRDAPNSVFDGDGSAIVIHAGADDYMSQPSGAAGDRIACGVIR